MSEAVIVPNLMMALIVSEESLARDRQIDRPHTHFALQTKTATVEIFVCKSLKGN